MSTDHSYENDGEQNYSSNSFSRPKRETASERARPVQGRQRGKSPQSVNGIHKRRRRKMSW